DRRAQHPERNLVAVDGRRELRLARRGVLLEAAREVAEVALTREPPQLARAKRAVDRGADRLCALERRHVLVIAVDGLEVEVHLQAREVLVVLLVERGDEAVDALAVAVELGWRGSSGHGA